MNWLRKLPWWHLPAIIMVLVIFSPVLFGDRVFYDGDTGLQFWQYLNAVDAGAPQVHPGLLGGQPLSVSNTGVWFNPVVYVGLRFLSVVQVQQWILFFYLLLAYGCMYGWLRQWQPRHDRTIAALGATIYVFSGHIALWYTTVANASYFWILPAVLWCVDAAVARHRWWLAVVAGICVGSGWLSSHVQFVVYVCLMAAVYAAWRSWRGQWNWLRAVIWLGIMAAVSVAIGWSQISAMLGFSASTSRSGGVTLADYFIGSYGPQDLIHFLLPRFTVPFGLIGNPNLYIGLFSLVVCVVGLSSWRRLQNRDTKFFLSIFLLCVAAGVMWSPLGLVIHWLPIVNAFREGTRIMFVGHVMLAAAVAGIVTEMMNNMASWRPSWERARSWVWWGGVITAVIVSVFTIVSFTRAFIYGWAELIFTRWSQTRHLVWPRDHYIGIIHQTIDQFVAQLSWTNRDILVLMLSAVVVWWLLGQWPRWQPRQILLSCLLVVSASSIGTYAWRDPTISAAELTQAPESVTWLQSQVMAEQPFRVFSIFPGQVEFVEFDQKCAGMTAADRWLLQQSVLAPNTQMAHGLESIDGYDNFMTRRQAEILAAVGSERATAGDLVAYASQPVADRLETVMSRSSWLAAMNVRYLVSGYPLANERLSLRWSSTIGRCGIPVYIYEITNVWPRAFVAGSATSIDQDNLQAVFGVVASSSRPAVTLAAQNVAMIPTSSLATTTIDVAPRWQEDQLVTTVPPGVTGVLYLNYAWLPGWQAWTDEGVSLPIWRANYNFMAVPLPSGVSSVIFDYR